MAFDLLTGRRGTGKSKLALILMQEHLKAGRRVATNLNVWPEKMLPPSSRCNLVRVPDKPTVADLELLGDGNNGDAYNEEHNGLLILDELGTWLNARTFSDKSRGPLIDWLVHSRKHGWECVMICQDLVQIDKQVRDSLVEYVTRCTRADKVRWPFVGWIIAALFGERAACLPKFHRAVRRLGCDPHGLIARVRMYRDGGVQSAYDTRQVFRDDYPHGPHSLLSPWHVLGRHLPPVVPWWRRLMAGAVRGSGAKRPTPAPRLAIVQRLHELAAPDDRIRHMRRLIAAGLV